MRARGTSKGNPHLHCDFVITFGATNLRCRSAKTIKNNDLLVIFSIHYADVTTLWVKVM